jgi:uncharacterized protein (TIGR01244 family)
LPDFRAVTDSFAVSPQLSLADVEAAAEAGFSMIINNRPDSEAADQPTGAQIAAAAERAGLVYAFVPIVGRPTAEQAAAVNAAAARAPGKVLAYCRSGTRSITAWALGEAEAGMKSRAELIRLARAAGYDLGGMLGA